MITICIPCGYIYKGELAFEFLADDWCCPDCGASMNSFQQIDVTIGNEAEQINGASEMALMKNVKP